jgi:hypothetical protein
MPSDTDVARASFRRALRKPALVSRRMADELWLVNGCISTELVEVPSVMGHGHKLRIVWRLNKTRGRARCLFVVGRPLFLRLATLSACPNSLETCAEREISIVKYSLW